mgnify:CR=1 FL=1
MHPAARQHIYCTIEMIRKALEGIEAALTVDARGIDDSALRKKPEQAEPVMEIPQLADEEERSLNEAMEKMWQAHNQPEDLILDPKGPKNARKAK